MATNPFGPRRQDESLYTREIRSFIDRHIASLLGLQTPEELLTDLPGVSAGGTFATLAENIAYRMVARQNVQNAKSWREAAARSSYGARIHAALRMELAGEKSLRIAAMVEENAKLIKSIPRELTASTTRYIAQQQQAGRRSEDIMRDLRKRIPQLTKSKAALIARTEVAKAETAFTRVRSEALGSGWYLWRTSEDAFVRKAHRLFDGVLVAWSDPPSPEQMAGIKSMLGTGAPGEFPNCRCIALPIVSPAEVQWPCRVYSNRTIQRMTRSAFQKRFGLRVAA